MPLCECLACRASFYRLSLDAALPEWRAKWAPGLPAEAPAPVLCGNCITAAERGILTLDDLELPAELVARLREQLGRE